MTGHHGSAKAKKKVRFMTHLLNLCLQEPLGGSYWPKWLQKPEP